MPLWVNPWMLLGAAAVAVPVILHLTLRRKAERVPFSRIILLAEIPHLTERRIKLKQLLLLMLRMLIILLLALAFARPAFTSPPVSNANKPQAVFVLVDVSGSMACGNRLPDAVAKVKERIASLGPADRVGLAVFASSPRMLCELTNDSASVLAALQNQVTCTQESTRLAPALQLGVERLADIQGCRRIIVLASDLQQSGVRDLDPAWKLPRGVELEILKVGSEETDNSCVADATVAEPGPIATARVARALVARFSATGEAKADATLEINGKAVETKSVELAAGQRREVEFTLPENAEGAACVRLAEDAMPSDDARWFVIAPHKKQPVAVLTNNPNDPAREEAIFLASALAGAGETSYEVRHFLPAELVTGISEAIRLIVVPGDCNLTGEQCHALEAKAQAGDTVLIGCGARTASSAALMSLADVKPIGWLELDRAAGAFRMLADFDTRDPIFAAFRGSRRGNFTAADFYGYERVTPGPSAVALASFDDGAPALVARKVGHGKVLLYASSLGTRWNNLPSRGLYVALMLSIAHSAYEEAETPRAYLVGAGVDLVGVPNAVATVKTPDGALSPLKLDAKGEGRFAGAGKPGVYSVDKATPALFAVNMDSAESDLESAHEEDLKLLLSAPEDTAAGKSRPISSIDAKDLAKASLVWKYLLAALLVTAIAESFVANRTHS